MVEILWMIIQMSVVRSFGIEKQQKKFYILEHIFFAV